MDIPARPSAAGLFVSREEVQCPSEWEKMVAGELYDPLDRELVSARDTHVLSRARAPCCARTSFGRSTRHAHVCRVARDVNVLYADADVAQRSTGEPFGSRVAG